MLGRLLTNCSWLLIPKYISKIVWCGVGGRSRSSQAGTQATASTMIQGKFAGGNHGGGLGGGTRYAVSCDEASRGGDPDGAEVWRAKVELTAHGSEAEAGTRKIVVEPGRPRTTAEV
jgi:hypothetical protein